MNPIFPPTIVIRHRKENLKKCSLRGLETRPDFRFFRYPLQELPPYSDYVLLSIEGTEELTPQDSSSGLLIVDATWKYAQQMQKNLPDLGNLKLRKLPKKFLTAYPRRQNDCIDPESGLASIEAIFCAYAIMGRSCEGLLDHYYWQSSFLEKNQSNLLKFNHEKTLAG